MKKGLFYLFMLPALSCFANYERSDVNQEENFVEQRPSRQLAYGDADDSDDDDEGEETSQVQPKSRPRVVQRESAARAKKEKSIAANPGKKAGGKGSSGKYIGAEGKVKKRRAPESAIADASQERGSKKKKTQQPTVYCPHCGEANS